MQKDLDSFVPILRTAEQEVKDCLQVVEGLQTEYSEGREMCKQQEIEIEKMTAPIAELERLAKIELDKVSCLPNRINSATLLDDGHGAWLLVACMAGGQIHRRSVE